MSAQLVVDGLVRAFGGVRALDGTTFEVEGGSITGLIGPNGAGKSTAFNCVSGFVRAQAGRVLHDGRRIDRLPPHRIARGGLVRTFQTPRTLKRMTVLDNVLLPAAHDEERAAELLALVGLDSQADALAGTLSGGQRKLLDLIRALMARPRILLLDEPMAGVAPRLRGELLQHILQLRDRDGITLLIVEHDLDFVMAASDRVIVMNNGRVIAAGTPDEVRGDERVLDAYLGTRHVAA